MSDQASIFRVILPVPDIERAVAFYARLLASETGRRVSPYRHYFDCGAVLLALVDPTPDGVTAPWGERSFYAEDPFGNPLCFVERGSEFTGR